MLIRFLHQKAVGKDLNLEETIGEYECSKLPKLCLSQMDRCVVAVSQVDRCAERDSLEDGGDIGWKMGSTHLGPLSLTDSAAITRTYTMVYKLRVTSKCPCKCTLLR